jgi:hypothetical protein
VLGRRKRDGGTQALDRLAGVRQLALDALALRR